MLDIKIIAGETLNIVTQAASKLTPQEYVKMFFESDVQNINKNEDHSVAIVTKHVRVLEVKKSNTKAE